MATWEMINFQDSNSPISDNLISFYNLTFITLIMIVTVTLFILLDLIFSKYYNRYMLKNHNLEILWTIVPIIILLWICFPSLKILYYIDDLVMPVFSIKILGHQWYWAYEYPEFCIEFDSYMTNSLDNLNSFRLLDVDNRLIIPIKTSIRLLTTSMDVIHSWTIPSLGVKMDSTPGRINQSNLFTYRPGLFFGQCSEICGINHSFMPICLESTLFHNFLNWLNLT